jgi:hypothetical protein
MRVLPIFTDSISEYHHLHRNMYASVPISMKSSRHDSMQALLPSSLLVRRELKGCQLVANRSERNGLFT